MKILILNTWYYPNLKGGAEHSVKILAEGLVKAGNVVCVFSIDNIEKKIICEKINGVFVYRGYGGVYNVRKAYTIKGNFIGGIKKKFFELCNYSIKKELEYVYEHFKPDIVHAHCISGISLQSIYFFKKRKIPFVYTIRDFFIDNHKNVNDDLLHVNCFFQLLLHLYRNYSRKLTKNIDAVVAPSSYMLRYMLSRNYFKKSQIQRVICNCVDVDINKIKICINSKRMHKKRNFIFAGSLVDVKGVKEMIEAFSSTHIDSTLTICGDGPLVHFVEKAAEMDHRIIYVGKQGPTNMENFLLASDVIIVPSLWNEPFGRVVIEGAKFGLVVIASDRGGLPEVMMNLNCGIIWHADNVTMLKKQIESFFYEESLQSFYSNILKNISKYSIAQQIKDYIQLYNECLFND